MISVRRRAPNGAGRSECRRSDPRGYGAGDVGEHSGDMSAELVRTVTVTGTASASATPGPGRRCRSACSRGGRRRSRAMQVVDERAATLVSALRDAGARDEDLRTTGLNLWFDQSEREYVASYTITRRRARRRRRALHRRRRRGRRRRADDERRLVLDRRPGAAVAPLRELAVADARAKAEVLAAAAGCALGPVVTIVEGGGGGAVPCSRAAPAALAMAAPIEAGSETLSLQVTVTYELTSTCQRRPPRSGSLGSTGPGRRPASERGGEEVGGAGGDGRQQAGGLRAGPGWRRSGR